MKTTKLIIIVLVTAFAVTYAPSISFAEEGEVTAGDIIGGGLSGGFYWLKQVLELYTPTDWLLGKSYWSSGVLILFVFSIMLVLRWPLRLVLRRIFSKRKEEEEEEEERKKKGIGWWIILLLYPVIRFFVLLPMEHGEDSLDMMIMFWILLPSFLLLVFALWFKWLGGLFFAFNNGGDTLGQKFLRVLTPWVPSPFWYYFQHSGFEKTDKEDEEKEDDKPAPSPDDKPPAKKGPMKSKWGECPSCKKLSLGPKICSMCGAPNPKLTQEAARPQEEPLEKEVNPSDWDEV